MLFAKFIRLTLLAIFCVNSAYAEAESLHPRTAGFPLDTVKTKCIELSGIKIGGAPDDVADCRVSEFGILGTFKNHTYYYAIYCLIPGYSINEGACASGTFNAEYHKARALAVFVGDEAKKAPQLLLERAEPEIGTVWYERPEIVTNAAGTFLHLPIHLDGTGAGNMSQYYLWDEKAADWQSVESESWTKNLQIPTGLSINKGIWPNLKNMSAEAYLYRAKDANCCPTGGTALIKLKIEDSRFVVKSLTFNLEENKKQ